MMKCTREDADEKLEVELHIEVLEEVESFKYLGATKVAIGRVELDVLVLKKSVCIRG